MSERKDTSCEGIEKDERTYITLIHIEKTVETNDSRDSQDPDKNNYKRTNIQYKCTDHLKLTVCNI